MRLTRLLLTNICMAFLAHTAMAQQATGTSTDSINFRQLVDEVEAAAAYHFYYDSTEVKNLKLPAVALNVSVQNLLEASFKNSGYHYAIDGSNNIFITKNAVIQTELPEDYFDKDTAANEALAAIPFEETETTTSNKRVAAANKVVEIGTASANNKQGNVTLAGYIKDIRNGEAVVGATVAVDNTKLVVVTDQFGYYSLTLAPGHYKMLVNSVGMKEAKREIVINGDGKLNVELQNDVPSLKSVTVMSQRNSNIKSLQMGVERLNIATIKKVPVLLGEADVLRVVLALPGVTSVGEASTGFNVRGGSADQNLIYYNNATIYNPAHFFGFFSAFNPDVIKNVELYKSSIPEKYGGRLSSVLDVTTRDGNSKKWTGSAGIGLLTSKFVIEGPIKKDKTSVIIGGRTTYSNWLLKRVPGDYDKSKASFYDLDFHLTHTINAKNNLYVSGYLSNDKFNLNSDTSYNYGNRNAVIKWKHIFNNKMNATFAGALNHYEYEVAGNGGTVKGFDLKSSLNQSDFHADFSYVPSNNHSFDFGLSAIKYKIYPGSYEARGTESLVSSNVVAAEQALENALYFGDKITLSSKLSLQAGIRYSLFNYLGPREVFSYIDGLPKEESTIQDTTFYPKNKIIKTYQGPEYRASLRYILSPNSSLKLGFNSLRQYIHLLSSTTAITPTDVWKLSDANIQPQIGKQVSLGYYLNFKSNTIETSVEIYYKDSKNFLDYKSGAAVLLNHHVETDVIGTRGKAYGAEFLIKKSAGKLNGWLSYSYSRTLLRTSDSTINNGTYYPANYDKPHNVNCISSYNFSHRYSVSLNAVYSTGRPITLPIAIFDLAGSQRILYSERNKYRVPDYFRMDFSMNIDGNHKVKKLTHNSWSFGVYNLTFRKNPYSVYFVQENGIIKGYKFSIIGTAIPYITYNIKF